MDTVPALYPLQFSPIFKDYPWGGRNLARYGRSLPDGIVAESWDVAAHPNGSSPIRDGALQGRSLVDAMEVWGEALLGDSNQDALARGRFPLLIKLLDANTFLSVQVHPDDAYAFAHEGELGKTEMWIVLHAQPGAYILFGWNEPMTREKYAEAIAEGRSAEVIQKLPVQVGDTIFVAPGTIHALGEGVIVAEIQQNSDTTYRVYDWGRPRPLHIEKALDVFDYAKVKPGVAKPALLLDDAGMRVEVLATCPFFQTERVTMPDGGAFFGDADGESFEIFGVLEGTARLEWDGEPVTLSAIDWALVPADLGEFQVVADDRCVFLRIFVPD
jgi:mannose-6-phosphate isomerase